MSAAAQDLLRVVVVGGGLAGLSTVYELVRRARTEGLAVEIRLYEASDRLGGAVRTGRRDEFVLEYGPDSFATDNPEGLRLVAELGIVDELIAAHAERGTSIWWNDGFHPMPPGLAAVEPDGVRALFQSSLLSFTGKARAALEPMVPGRRGGDDETVAAFVRRRFGRQVLERVGDPMLAGARAGDPTMLAIGYAFPHLKELEREHGSVSKGIRQRSRARLDGEAFPRIPEKITRSPLVSFRDGMQALVDGLVAAIRQGDTGALHPGNPVRSVRPAGNPVGAAEYEVELEGGETWVADVCVLAIPARPAAELIEPFAPEIAVELGAVPHASSLTVHLAYGPGVARRLPETTVCLVPHSQGRPISSCVLAHRMFDYRVPAGSALLTVHMGGMRKPELVRGNDEIILRIARQEVNELFGMRNAEPLFAEVRRWPSAHPQYVVGHDERIAAVEEHLDLHTGLFVVGSALYGVGVPEAIASGRGVAATIADIVRTRLA